MISIVLCVCMHAFHIRLLDEVESLEAILMDDVRIERSDDDW